MGLGGGLEQHFFSSKMGTSAKDTTFSFLTSENNGPVSPLPRGTKGDPEIEYIQFISVADMAWCDQWEE